MDVHSILSAIAQAAMKPGEALLSGHERIFWLYLASALVLSVVVYVRQGQPVSAKGFAGYAFPKDVFRHSSALVDYQFVILALPVLALMSPIAGGVSLAVSGAVQATLSLLGAMPLMHAGPVISTVGYTLMMGVALDFTLFLAHYFQHKVPWMWEFHKTHHSAEVLTPMTVYRMHPVDDLFAFLLMGLILGLLDGVFRTLVHGSFGELTIFHLNLLFFGFYLVGYNLRHSHIWLDYGPRWSRVFVSPAQHQIHHSIDERHHDKNMGFIFGFWDAIFGTQYIPKEREVISFGLNKAGEHREYASVWTLLMKPFNKVGVHSAIVVVLILVGIGGWLEWRLAPPGFMRRHENEKLMMEDLTSPEIKQRIADGYTTVIMPTGGMEQSGPHLVLGKHNYVVRYTTGEIAQELGHTLVAPVLPFSPAGDIDPPTGHMLFPGTISLQEPAYAAVLEAEARSLKQAGFKLICIIGDHGSSQPPQTEVANKLTEEWRQQGVRVLEVDDYYAHNGQMENLLISGYSAKEIGQHAGIRDTSELWRLDPSGVRVPLMKASNDFNATGVDGNPLRASPELGEQFLRMKITAAVRQIRSVQAEQPTAP